MIYILCKNNMEFCEKHYYSEVFSGWCMLIIVVLFLCFLAISDYRELLWIVALILIPLILILAYMLLTPKTERIALIRKSFSLSI